jgi:hypothetical protein
MVHPQRAGTLDSDQLAVIDNIPRFMFTARSVRGIQASSASTDGVHGVSTGEHG